jgi:hypothetical protein
MVVGCLIVKHVIQTKDIRILEGRLRESKNKNNNAISVDFKKK